MSTLNAGVAVPDYLDREGSPACTAAAAIREDTMIRMGSQFADSRLTRRQHEIVSLVSTGLSNKEIARRLNVTEGTVKLHLHAIYAKLGIPNRTKLALFAWQNSDGLLATAS